MSTPVAARSRQFPDIWALAGPVGRTAALLLALALACTAGTPTRAQSPPSTTLVTPTPVIDPHALYEQRCAGCHQPHGADFARTEIKALADVIVGARTGRPLTDILPRHRGTRQSPEEVMALLGHFGAILPTGWLYQEKCTACHDRAVKLARERLTTRDGRLVGRYSGRDITTFLAGHGRLDPAQQAVISSMLRRQLDTQPP